MDKLLADLDKILDANIGNPDPAAVEVCQQALAMQAHVLGIDGDA